MKRLSASKARARLADVLDEVERGGAVVIERGDVQYEIRVKRRTPLVRAASRIEVLDRAVATGNWGWTSAPQGLKFSGRRKRR